jgi:thiol:disulfide interchange protein DsbD
MQHTVAGLFDAPDGPVLFRPIRPLCLISSNRKMTQAELAGERGLLPLSPANQTHCAAGEITPPQLPFGEPHNDEFYGKARFIANSCTCR